MDDFTLLIQDLASRPGKFVNNGSLRLVATFLDGYTLAREQILGQNPLIGWREWVEVRFDISHSAWHWTRILHHHFGSEETALLELPALFEEFDKVRKKMGLKEILAKHQEVFGDPLKICVPTITDTPEPEVKSINKI